MIPAAIRRRKGFRPAYLAAASTATLIAASPALAQTNPQIVKSAMMSGAVPMAVTAGLALFGLLAAGLALKSRNRAGAQARQASEELALIRSDLDDYEALLATMPEVTIFWSETHPVRVLGSPPVLSETLRSGEDVLNFNLWLPGDDVGKLDAAASQLRLRSRGFDLTLTSLDGATIRAVGRPSGSGVALKLRRAISLDVPTPLFPERADIAEHLDPARNPRFLSAAATAGADPSSARAILSLLHKPAWIRDADGQISYANTAYMQLAARMGKLARPDPSASPVEIFAPSDVRNQLGQLAGAEAALSISDPLPQYPQFELVLFKLSEGSAGYLGHVEQDPLGLAALAQGQVPGVIEALVAPVVVFDKNGRLVHFNSAYAEFFGLDEAWLKSGVSEKLILDKLRNKEHLPAVADYQGWKREHLKNYQLKQAKEDTWYLPDGRTINFVVAPAGGDGGLIYVFEDVSEKLKLETEKKALVNVQRETLNALSEGVAVFSPDGRLRLHNPKISVLWKLPTNLLAEHPHINELAKAVKEGFPEDGQRIWGELKRNVVNLNPTRSDVTGRINRSDGRLIDYCATPLPDGQVMLTFVDVTQSANYERVLKERNEALETADRLKDAFVQSVSYELRSPLTNIIGFADLLASDAFGPLNERQRQYTDYIRAQSATLGVLIDNILDLTHVDAGIAELEIDEHDIRDLVQRARAGLDATFTGSDGEEPINLTLDIPDDLPTLQADGKRIVQILYNLLSNAAKFSDPGSRVTLRAEAHDNWMNLIVEDEGFGVPAELRNAMFQRFEGRSVEGRSRGAGLGLTIANAFVQLHGGSISFEGREPHGTRVTVHLPIKSAVQSAAPAEPQGA
ncbi:MAG: PAS-domain containing protein [Hyphomicrobiaceae bacterium]|nr:PAS-domain containing protein [Hyphomicrobiaceae bacterium]MCC0023978.1 PAS-domain containing protein [Hyphomicrobiaceae bacterium]